MHSGIRSYAPVTRGLDHASRIYPTCASKMREIGYTRLRWSIFFVKAFRQGDGLHRNSGLPELRSLMRCKSGGYTRLAVSSPAMTSAVIRCQR
jgi:hypothetical protein